MLEELINMVGNSGRVITVAGGYEIAISNVEEFPWYKVCMFLLDSSFEVWMVKSGSNIILMSKPVLD